MGNVVVTCSGIHVLSSRRSYTWQVYKIKINLVYFLNAFFMVCYAEFNNAIFSKTTKQVLIVSTDNIDSWLMLTSGQKKQLLAKTSVVGNELNLIELKR